MICVFWNSLRAQAWYRRALPLLLILTFSCEPQIVDEYLPYTLVDEQVNLSNPSYLNLNVPGGYAYNQGGVRGIIIYADDAHSYSAFDRVCTYQPSNACATVEVTSSGQHLIDPCCNSVFDFSGTPQSGPARRPLIKYQVRREGSILYIFN